MNQLSKRHVPFSVKKLDLDKKGPTGTTLKTLLGQDQAAYEQFLEKDMQRLYDFTQRELEYHDALNDLAPNEIDAYEIMDEAVVRVLAKQKQPKLKLGRELYQSALDVLHEKVNKLEERERREQSLEANVKDPAVEGGFRTLGEHVLDFWQPDQDLASLDMVPDPDMPTPAEIQDMKARQKELYSSLHALPQLWRENFILLAVERWPVREIAEMREVSEEKIKDQLGMTQAFLRDRLRDRLLLTNRSPRQQKHTHDRG